MNRINKWFMKRALLQTVFEAARVLCIIGGLVVLLSGLFFFALSLLALGLVAIVISGHVKHLLWSAIIIIVGVIAYRFDGGGTLWSYGPILMVAGGVAGVLAHLVKRT